MGMLLMFTPRYLKLSAVLTICVFLNAKNACFAEDKQNYNAACDAKEEYLSFLSLNAILENLQYTEEKESIVCGAGSLDQSSTIHVKKSLNLGLMRAEIVLAQFATIAGKPVSGIILYDENADAAYCRLEESVAKLPKEEVQRLASQFNSAPPISAEDFDYINLQEEQMNGVEMIVFAKHKKLDTSSPWERIWIGIADGIVYRVEKYDSLGPTITKKVNVNHTDAISEQVLREGFTMDLDKVEVVSMKELMGAYFKKIMADSKVEE